MKPVSDILATNRSFFSGTIEENICMGKPGDIGPVLRAVCIDREEEEFPDGIHTVIGNGGIRLSDGQQAQIALVRTLYHRKPLMVLDDPFSSVDMAIPLSRSGRPWTW